MKLNSATAFVVVALASIIAAPAEAQVGPGENPIYQQFCVPCHNHAGGYGVAAMYLAVRPKDFTDKPRAELRQMILDGRGAMPPFKFLPSSEIEELVDHVLSRAGRPAPSHAGFEKERATKLLEAYKIDREPEYVLEVLRRNGWARLSYPDRPGVCIEISPDKQIRAVPLPPSDRVDLSPCPR